MKAMTEPSRVEERDLRFRNILFLPLAKRGNVAAIRRVASLVRRDDAALTILGVVPEPSHFQRLLHGSQHVETVLAAAHHEMESRLSRCERAVDDLGVTPIVDVGHPALAVITRSIAASHDLLVITVDGDDDERATTKRLIRKSPCPVWIIRPSRAKQVRVLAAIDPEPDERALNASILEIADSVADARGGELHVVSAWELFGEATMRSSAFMHVEPDEIEHQRQLVREAHEAAVAELVDRHVVGSDRVAVHVRDGAASAVIADVVKRERINLVVMGTFGRRGVAGLVMGNTAEEVLDDLRCSVIAVKPPDVASSIGV